MPDNVIFQSATLATAPSGSVFAFDQVTVDATSVLISLNKIGYGAGGSYTDVTTSAGLPVQQQSGATFAVTQSGTWTVQPGNTANTTAWLVTGTGGTFPVTDSGGSLTVDNGGTFAVQAAQSGTWTVQPGNTANTTAWLVTGTGGTFPVTDSGGSITVDNGGTFAVQAAQSGTWNITNISGTVSLPTGASTAAKQPALGTAGTASADVITIQGIASMTAVKVDGSAVTQPVSGTVAATQSGSWTVLPGNTANTTAWLVTGTGGTFPITDSGGSITVDNGGTFAVQAAQSGTWTVQPGNTANTTAWLVTGTGGTFPVTDSGGSLTVDNGGTFAVQAAQSGTWNVATVTTVTTVSTVTAVSDAQVQGKAAEDAALSGNPVRMGGLASYAEPTAMSADGDVVTPWNDRRGRRVVKQQCGTGTTSSANDSATSATILAANTARLGATVFNDSSEILYIKCGATASATDYTVKVLPGGYWEAPYGYSGRLDGIWAVDGSGAARVTEFT